MPGSILGTAVTRVEDPDLLTGLGTYVDNLPIDGVLHLAFVRSTMAHARLLSVEVEEARAMPGVVGVFTAGDLGLPPHKGFAVLNPGCLRPPLAVDKVRFVGDCIAAVVASSRAEAADAAEAVVVDYDPLPAVVDMEDALAPDAPLQFEDLGSNVASGYQAAPEVDPLDGAEVVVRARFENQRVAVVPLEGNAIAVEPDPFTVYVSTQMPHNIQGAVAETFGLDLAEVRVVTPHVGGGFGGKAGLVAEHAVVIAAARLLGRPVKWVETRTENMVGMPHGRGQVQYVELGLKRDGEITGLRCRMVGDAGAYAGFGGGLVLGSTSFMAQGTYRIPAISYSAVAALTNTTPMGAFRGAGRPEATAFLERIIDMAADELDIDPVDIRRRNFIPPSDFPLTTKTGAVYDSGDYDAALSEALRLADYDGLRREQARRQAVESGQQMLLGIGVCAYVEVTAGGGASEFAAVEVDEAGEATIRVGTSAHGQGHATSFAMIVADRLGIPMSSIRFVQSDTAEVPRGGGTGGSRSLQIGGTAVSRAADGVLDRARTIVGDLLEASPEDIVVTDDGRLGVAGVPSRAVTWAEVSAAAAASGDGPLAVALDSEQAGPTFPFGAHVSVVEVDTETGLVTPVRHVAVDDCGRIVNPLIVTGQQHGGIAQGMAQALWEQVLYDEDGNPVTSNLADYAIPSAVEFPMFETANTETPSPLNPLGAKGIGESGTIGATAAVHNAVVDALSVLGVRHIDMPCTPERVWRAVQDARAGTLAPVWREPPPVFETLRVRGRRRTEAEQVDV